MSAATAANEKNSADKEDTADSKPQHSSKKLENDLKRLKKRLNTNETKGKRLRGHATRLPGHKQWCRGMCDAERVGDWRKCHRKDEAAKKKGLSLACIVVRDGI